VTRDAPVQIEPVPVTHRRAALSFLLGEPDRKDVIRFREDGPCAVDPHRGEGLFWARRNGRILAVAWAMPVPGSRMLQVTLPHCAAAASSDLPQRMLRHLSDHLNQTSSARLAQLVLDPGTAWLARAASQIGFRPAATLLWMATEPRCPGAPLQLQLQACDPGDRPRLLTVLEATFRGSLDCPTLATLLEPTDYLAAFEARCPVEQRGQDCLRRIRSKWCTGG
jgi:hypothetical protein